MAESFDNSRQDRAAAEYPPATDAREGGSVAAARDERPPVEGRDQEPVREGRGERQLRQERPIAVDSAADGDAAQRRRGVRSRYGGFDWVATFLGFAVAIFFLIVLLGVVGAIAGSVASQIGATGPSSNGSISGTTQNLGLGAVIGAVVALFLAYFIGGYGAGRLARYDGVANGVGVVGWTVVVAIVLGVLGALLGSKFNVASQLHLNISPGTLQAGGVISLVVTLLVMVLAAALGGGLGSRYHRRIDTAAGIVA